MFTKQQAMAVVVLCALGVSAMIHGCSEKDKGGVAGGKIPWESADHNPAAEKHYLTVTEFTGPTGAKIGVVVTGLYTIKGTYDLTGSEYRTAEVCFSLHGETYIDPEFKDRSTMTIAEGQLKGTFELSVKVLAHKEGSGLPNVWLSSGSTMLDEITLH